MDKENAGQGRYPNFDSIRLLAAAAVVYSHSFLIATGQDSSVPLGGTGRSLGVYAVFVFFILSGFLVTESAKRSATVLDYLRKRFLRIAPAFVVSTFVVIYLICPFFAQDGGLAFIMSGDVLSAALQLIFLHTDGLFFANVPFYPRAGEQDWMPFIPNGVLWSIRLEIIGYAGVALFKAFGLLKLERQVYTLPLLAGLAALCVFMMPHMSSRFWSSLALVMPSLCCGVAMNWIVRFHQPRWWIAALSAAGLIAAAYFGVLPAAFAFFAAYPVIWLGAVQAPFLRLTPRGTDISYGLYLYGWPVQQLLRAALGPGYSGYVFAAMAIPATAAVAFLSWRLIEKPALAFKPGARPEDENRELGQLVKTKPRPSLS